MFARFFFTCCLIVSVHLHSEEKPYVTANLYGQLGNNLFQIATAYALAWDNGAEPIFPDLRWQKKYNIPFNSQHVFFRCSSKSLPMHCSKLWKEQSYRYIPISYQPNMCIDGYFQSEKYFAHHRERLLELFAPHPNDLDYIEKKYQKPLSHPCSVGVQIRFQHEDPKGVLHIQYGRDYLNKAIEYFPKDALYIVSSNNIAFAKKQMPSHGLNVIFLEGESYHIDFFLLSLCDHNIITNSTFGWWAAWLNQNPDKMVICPRQMLSPTAKPDSKAFSLDSHFSFEDLWPKDWIQIDAKWGRSQDPDAL